MLLLTALPWKCIAESTLDIYLGNTRTHDSGIDIEILYITPAVDLSYSISDSSNIYGIRNISWLDSIAGLGLGFGLSSFDAETPEISTQLVPLSLMAAYRWKLADFRPYVGIGALLVYYTLDTQYSSELGGTFSENGFDDGREFFAGIAWPQNEKVRWFIEFKHTDIDVDFETRSIYLPPLSYATVTKRLDGSYKSNHLILGISLMF